MKFAGFVTLMVGAPLAVALLATETKPAPAAQAQPAAQVQAAASQPEVVEIVVVGRRADAAPAS